MNRTPGILDDILAERRRQEELHGDRTAAHPGSMDDGLRLAILTEEVGEVAKELCEWDRLDHRLPGPTYSEALSSESRIRAELVQVAAVAVAWVETIDERMSR